MGILSAFLTAEDTFMYLCENLGGALLHFFEMPLLKFFQPHPIALEENTEVFTHFDLLLFVFFFYIKREILHQGVVKLEI